jgi:glycosyltransferase involved in cell wall biosynthesis
VGCLLLPWSQQKNSGTLLVATGRRTAVILFLTSQGSASSGSENLWIKTAVSMAKRGCRVSVLVPDHWAQSTQAVDLSASGVIVHFFSPGRSLWQRLCGRLQSLQFLRGRIPGCGLRAKVRRLLHDADALVLTQGGLFDLLFFTGLVPFVAEMKVPYVLNVRSGRGLPGGVPTQDRTASATLFAKAAGIVLPTHANVADIEDLLGVRPSKVRAIHSPVKNLGSSEIPWPAGSVVRFACPCRLEASEKGLDLLIDAAALLKDHPTPFEISVYGTGPDESYLRELIAYRGVVDRVMLRGAYLELDEVWRQNHLLVLPSRSEGLPQTLMEAMVAGRPAVATKVGGVAELLVDGRNGFIAAMPTAEVVADAMRRAIDASRQLEAMGCEARNTARQKLQAHPEEEFCDFIEELLLLKADGSRG